jgi:hypothetical protein
VLCDFIGAAETGPHRWAAGEVIEVMGPYLNDLAARGVGTLVDCSPAYIGRDPALLARLAEITGLRIVTNTGWYKAPYLPAHAYGMTADEIAAGWMAEWRLGIDDTGYSPGFHQDCGEPGRVVAHPAHHRAGRRVGHQGYWPDGDEPYGRVVGGADEPGPGGGGEGWTCSTM